MSNSGEESKPPDLSQDVKDMKIEPSIKSEETGDAGLSNGPVFEHGTQNSSVAHPPNLLQPSPLSTSQTPKQSPVEAPSPATKMEYEESIDSNMVVKSEQGQPPKLSRSTSKKVVGQPARLFLNLPDATFEAKKGYETISACIYANKYIGTTEPAMECECNEEWDPSTQVNYACGEDSDCINRATKMECVGDCNCGRNCQNQRFQKKQYADVSVIKTEKKGYGLRTNTNLPANAFIFEYVGEVIGEAAFRKRMMQYDGEGIKHFYFMSLNKGEFVDATKKGNLGRFCNHSCNPNCYVDKWVVGDKLRMGIFSERKILAGEELVFNYNVDRYGADPQPCYCDEPNCTGFIGGKTQTERGTKLSAATIEALGIDDGEGWDLAVAKKARRKKPGEEDEDYVDRVQPKSLDEAGVVKVMATLMQCKEKWIAVKLLSRIQCCEEERVRNRVVKMHGYQILKSQLNTWIDDSNVVLQILDILNKLPRITRNKIQDSGIEGTVEKLLSNLDETVAVEAAAILKIWNALELGYRIPRHKRDPAALEKEWEDRRRLTRDRSRSRSKSRSKSPDIPKGPAVPSGPRARPGRNFNAPRGPPHFRRHFESQLPSGWFQATSNGKTYYYNTSGETTWQKPVATAAHPPPPPPKTVTHEQKLQDIIKSITSETEVSTTPPGTPPKSQPSEHATNQDQEKRKSDKKSYDEAKRRKLYEITISPHVMTVANKYKHKLPREDLKRFAKEVSKKIVDSDFKKNRISDSTEISSKQQKAVVQFTKEYFSKAYAKYEDRQKAKGKSEKESRRTKDKQEAERSNGVAHTESTPASVGQRGDNELFAKTSEDDVILSDGDAEEDYEPSPLAQDLDLKRKRDETETPLTSISPDLDAATPSKRIRAGEESKTTIPPELPLGYPNPQ